MNDWYKVEPGDCLNSIAIRHGLSWQTLLNHPQNQELKRKCKNPDVVLAGDQVFVPDVQEKAVSGATEQKHRFKMKGVPQRLVIQIKRDGEPLKGEKYVLKVEDRTFSGETDPEGWVNHVVPPEARNGKLIVGSGRTAMTCHLSLGHLDPSAEICGCQARLKNLGYDCGEISGEMNEATHEALRAFQIERGLEPTGKADDDTQKELESAHGS